MRDGRHDALDQLPGIDPYRLEFAPSSRVRLSIAEIRRSILAIDDLMNPSASVKSSESCLSAPSSTGSAVSVAFSGTAGARLLAGQRCDPPENVAAQFLQFAGEAHDVHQRRTQIVADDIGEALDFVIGFAKVGGALVDRGLEVEVVVAQLLRPRRARATSAVPGRPKCRPARSRGRSRRPSRRRRAIAFDPRPGAHREQAIFLGSHIAPGLGHGPHGVGRGAVARNRDAGGDVLVLMRSLPARIRSAASRSRGRSLA